MKQGETVRKTKKAVKAGIAATVAAASLLVSGTIDDPAALLRSDGPVQDAHVRYANEPEPRSYVIETDRLEPLTLRERACVWMQGLPFWLRTLVLLPLWGVGEALTVVGSALVSSPAGQAVLHFALAAAVLIGLFALIFHLLFPSVPLKTLFSKKNLPFLLGGALVLTVANAVLGLVWDEWKLWRILLTALIGAVVLGLLWYRICQKLPGPKRKRQRVELVVQ